MTQQEFEKRTGINTVVEFEYANRVYMAAGQMDKDAFCDEFQKKAIRESNIISALTLEVEGDRDAIRNLERQVRQDQETLDRFTSEMVDFLILQAEKWSASDLREKAIKLVGIKEYIRRRLEMTLGLWEDDRKALVEILKQDPNRP